MAHGGRRDGSGRKPKPDPALLDPRGQHPGPLSAADRACYGRILEALNTELPKDEEEQKKYLAGEPVEIRRWRVLVDKVFDLHADVGDRRLAKDTLEYLYDKRDGKAIQPVDVDATLDSSVTIYLGGLTPKEIREPGGSTPTRR